ncbi:MAG: hypothetical protein K2P70_06685 [Hyphomonadaceae bacterium]|nr:hypothetical protein [Hyphomonadaceae bacterium]
MRVLILALALTLAACAEPPAPQPEASPAPEAAAPAPPAIIGAFTAMSTTAMGVTGDLDVTPDVLSFAKGFRIEGGRIDASLGPNTDLSAGGGTIADGSGNTSVTDVELRRVENVRVAADARDPTFCGGETVTHVILARGAEALSVLVFSGADAPGPNAHDTQLCGIYNYFPA